jgi:hydroxyacylglutathione hydrolase
VFTGDTLFIAGCGRFFEGTATEMINALSYLSSLPDDTIVYTGHEYTKGNVAFAQTVEPTNEAIKKLGELTKQNEITQGISTIADEKVWNVFMRLGNEDVRAAMKATADTPDSDVMAALREAKNNFRG